MDTQIIDKLFLELSQFTRAKTSKELQADADRIVMGEIIKKNGELQTENKQLKEAIENYGNNPAGFDWAVLDKIDKLEVALERLLTLIHSDIFVKSPRGQVKKGDDVRLTRYLDLLNEADKARELI